MDENCSRNLSRVAEAIAAGDARAACALAVEEDAGLERVRRLVLAARAHAAAALAGLPASWLPRTSAKRTWELRG